MAISTLTAQPSCRSKSASTPSSSKRRRSILNETGQFEIERHADDSKRIEMKRFVELDKEGWFGGDLDVNRNAKDLPLIERAEGLRVVPNVEAAKTPEDAPLDIDGHLIARTPYAWNLPVWLASGKLTAIELIHRHSLREGVVDNENDGRPRDKTLFPGQRGNGRWSEAVYYHRTELRLPPTASRRQRLRRERQSRRYESRLHPLRQ